MAGLNCPDPSSVHLLSSTCSDLMPIAGNPVFTTETDSSTNMAACLPPSFAPSLSVSLPLLPSFLYLSEKPQSCTRHSASHSDLVETCDLGFAVWGLLGMAPAHMTPRKELVQITSLFRADNTGSFHPAYIVRAYIAMEETPPAGAFSVTL